MFTFTDLRGHTHTTQLNINFVIAKRLNGETWKAIYAETDDLSVVLWKSLRQSQEYYMAIGRYLRKNYKGIPPLYQKTFGVPKDALLHIIKAYS